MSPQFEALAIDDHNCPWIILRMHGGQRWVIGLDDDGVPRLRYIGDGNVVMLDLAKPDAFRKLTIVPGNHRAAEGLLVEMIALNESLELLGFSKPEGHVQ